MEEDPEAQLNTLMSEVMKKQIASPRRANRAEQAQRVRGDSLTRKAQLPSKDPK